MLTFFHPDRETYENERTKLIQQAQQLSVDLEQARENLALKSRDNLKLQEEVRISIDFIAYDQMSFILDMRYIYSYIDNLRLLN